MTTATAEDLETWLDDAAGERGTCEATVRPDSNEAVCIIYITRPCGCKASGRACALHRQYMMAYAGVEFPCRRCGAYPCSLLRITPL
jgi:hypothetical protein